MKRKITFVAFLIGFLNAGWALQISPTVQRFTVRPGEKVNGQCIVTNNEDQDLKISLTSKDWYVLPANKGISATTWLTFPEPEFALKKGESTTSYFVVDLPKQAQGELVGMMSFNMEGEVESNVQKVFSVAIYASAKGTEKQKARLKALMITPSTASFDIGALVENLGNVHIRPQGQCEILNRANKQVGMIYIERGAPIYPQAERVCSGQLSGLQLPAGQYKARLEIRDLDRNKVVIKQTKKFEILENNSVDIK